MSTDVELVAAAIRAGCCQPEADCPDGHAVHWSAASDGVIEEVLADVDALAGLVVAALENAGRLAGPGSSSPEPGPASVAPTIPAVVGPDDQIGVLAASIERVMYHDHNPVRAAESTKDGTPGDRERSHG